MRQHHLGDVRRDRKGGAARTVARHQRTRLTSTQARQSATGRRGTAAGVSTFDTTRQDQCPMLSFDVDPLKAGSAVSPTDPPHEVAPALIPSSRGRCTHPGGCISDIVYESPLVPH